RQPSSFSASLQNQFGLELVQAQLQPGRILMRVNGALDARSQHAELLLRPVANLTERRWLVHKLATAKNRNQKIPPPRLGRKALAARCIERVNDGEGGGHGTAQIIDRVTDKLAG